MLKTILILLGYSILLVGGGLSYIYFSTPSYKSTVDIAPQVNNEIPADNSDINTPPPVVIPPSTKIINSNSPIIISSCQTITTAGNYSVENDITNTASKPCIVLQGVSNISLDCKNHTITSKAELYDIYVSKSSNFKIFNCHLVSSINPPTSDITEHMFRIENSKQGEVYSNIINGNFASVSGSEGVTIRNNTFTNEFSVYRSNNIIIKDNDFSFSRGGSVVSLREGYNNSVISNTIDGESDGIWRGGEGQSIGVDDGITTADESRDLIQGNKIQNIWDCGIEPTGNLFDSKIIGNNVKNAGYCLLGGWYDSSVKGNLIKDNIGDDMPRLFVFFRARALRTNEHFVYFKDNTFENNKFINPRTIIAKGGGDDYMEASSFIIQATDVPSSSIMTGNNIFKNNNFTTISKPIIFTPANMIVDGGGNICPLSIDQNYPIKCNN